MYVCTHTLTAPPDGIQAGHESSLAEEERCDNNECKTSAPRQFHKIHEWHTSKNLPLFKDWTMWHGKTLCHACRHRWIEQRREPVSKSKEVDTGAAECARADDCGGAVQSKGTHGGVEKLSCHVRIRHPIHTFFYSHVCACLCADSQGCARS